MKLDNIETKFKNHQIGSTWTAATSLQAGDQAVVMLLRDGSENIWKNEAKNMSGAVYLEILRVPASSTYVGKVLVAPDYVNLAVGTEIEFGPENVLSSAKKRG